MILSLQEFMCRYRCLSVQYYGFNVDSSHNKIRPKLWAYTQHQDS